MAENGVMNVLRSSALVRLLRQHSREFGPAFLVFVGLSGLAGCAVARADGQCGKLTVAALLAWHIASGAFQHPDYLAYTNEIAGVHPERFVADSDLDWGQDMKRLAAFLQSKGADHVSFTPFNTNYPLGLATSPTNADAPSPGWNAVSVTLWKVFGFPAWADRMPFGIRIGRGILVWKVENNSASQGE